MNSFSLCPFEYKKRTAHHLMLNQKQHDGYGIESIPDRLCKGCARDPGVHFYSVKVSRNRLNIGHTDNTCQGWREVPSDRPAIYKIRNVQKLWFKEGQTRCHLHFSRTKAKLHTVMLRQLCNKQTNLECKSRLCHRRCQVSKKAEMRGGKECHRNVFCHLRSEEEMGMDLAKPWDQIISLALKHIDWDWFFIDDAYMDQKVQTLFPHYEQIKHVFCR